MNAPAMSNALTNTTNIRNTPPYLERTEDISGSIHARKASVSVP
jgi:hypothetical protein